MMVKATEMKSVNANLTKDELGDMHGTLVSENTIAIIHDHFLAFHMDLDVDGPNNSFVQGKLVRYSEPPEVSPRRSYWSVEKHVAKTEEEARIQLDLQHPSEFYVVNPAKSLVPLFLRCWIHVCLLKRELPSLIIRYHPACYHVHLKLPCIFMAKLLPGTSLN
jgi:hypothetical protein